MPPSSSDAQPGQSRGPNLHYVALGDSYSAASGVLPLDPDAAPICLRSIRNYPHLIADRFGARLHDVTCGNADTTDYKSSQYRNVAPQLNALGRDTDLVTMTIGGNDSNLFATALVKCGVAGILAAGRGSPCKDQNGSSFVDTLRNKTYPSLVGALRAVHRKAPHATSAILSYPRILPRRVGCFPTMPVARGDVPYLFRLQKVLNNVVRRAARKTHSTYVNVAWFSRGHDACQPARKRWVEPALLGTNPVIVHPNARGEAAMARKTVRVLRA